MSSKRGKDIGFAVQRRRFLRTIGYSAGGAALIGCGGTADGTSADGTSPTTASESTAGTAPPVGAAPPPSSSSPSAPSSPSSNPAPPPGQISPFRMASTVAGANLPFAFGHVFRQGDVPTGSVAIGDLADWQCSPLTRWPDGSLKQAIIAGRASFTAGTETVVALSAGTPPVGVPLSEADLSAALGSVQIGVGSHTTTLGSLVGTAARHRTVCTGPVMSNWIYRQPVSGSNHLVVWIDVRLYKGGSVEIFPWVENGYFLVAGPTNVVATCTVTVHGVQRFSHSIDFKHHTRVPLVSGSSFSYWVGTDPQITPRHDGAYVEATGLCPTFTNRIPTASWLSGLQTTYSPNTLAGADPAMGSAGNQGGVAHATQAAYVIGGGTQAWRAMIVFALSSGSWPIHFRDEGTNELFSWLAYPSASINIQETPYVPPGSGGTNQGCYVAYTHLTSYAFLPYLLTGRWWFLEECIAWCDRIYLEANVNQRTGSGGVGSDFIIDPTRGNGVNRGAHWAMARLSEALAAVPDTGYAKRADLINAWERNSAFYEAKFVTGTQDGGSWVSPQGFLGDFAEGGYSLYHSRITGNGGTAGNHWWGAAWMSAFGCLTWGRASDFGLPLSTAARESMIAVRDHAYKQVVQRGGDGSAGTWNWRRFVVYEHALGTDPTGLPPETMHAIGTSYTALLTAYSLSNPTAIEGLPLLERYSESPMAVGTAALLYFGQQVAALAYARTHNAPGAVDAWRRISTASNYASIIGSHELLAGNLDIAVSPRL